MGGSLFEVVERINLRSRVDRLIGRTWGILGSKDDKSIEANIAHYKLLRVEMSDVRIVKEDIESYDSRFINLPWNDCGYEVPNIT